MLHNRFPINESADIGRYNHPRGTYGLGDTVNGSRQFHRKEKSVETVQIHQQLQQEPQQSTTKSNQPVQYERWFGQKYLAKSKAFIFEFLEGASIHGFVYLAKIGLHLTERALWLVCICIAFFGIVSLSQRTWERYQTSPMVISMDRNKFVWNTSFPSLTVCPHKHIDDLKVDAFITTIHLLNILCIRTIAKTLTKIDLWSFGRRNTCRTYPEIFEDETDKNDFRNFIARLANSTFDNFHELPMNKTFGISSENYLRLLYELKWNFEPEMSSGTLTKMYTDETITEVGICYSVNSMIAKYSSYDYWQNNQWNSIKHPDKVTVHPLDGEIYAQIINLSTAYDVYFHGAMEVPDIAKHRYSFPESDYSTVELVALEIFASSAARDFTTKQRGCRFPHEADDMTSSPIYSLGLCLRECRMKLSLKMCNCVPHFYRNRLFLNNFEMRNWDNMDYQIQVRNGRVLPICDFDGLRCLSKIRKEIISLMSDKLKIDCNCLANCDDSNFFVQSLRSRVWFLGANLQWGINDYPKMQLRRDVLFSFADVLVYIGGLAGFFLGCSLLSITELIYFLTARFIKRLMAK